MRRGSRAFDVALTLALLPVAALAALPLALAVFLDSPGSVFFRSPRVGRSGRPFAMLKFRTMRTGASGPSLSAAGDERYTPLGLWLARWRLDELPQLWNVLRGEMRLVGPRPELVQFVNFFPDEYDRILSVSPGLTGPAQLAYAEEGRLLADVADREGVYLESILPLKVQIDLRYVETEGGVLADLVYLTRTALLPFQRLAARAWTSLSGPRPAPAALGATTFFLCTGVTLLALFVTQGAVGP
ncbi:MAG: sugar transferase [Solirubrobacteraceae bacterium MAG38_C4-C5]|nr:sugar transferase [Candidatus Siliceabacter maunaloa]